MGLDRVTHLVLPTIAIVLISFAVHRYTRSSMLEVLNQDYVRTARSKEPGRARRRRQHAFRNAMIPITVLMAFDFAGSVLSGAVITENVFGWTGLGSCSPTR